MGKAAGDILSCDWNPIIGCERYSIGCAHCWYLDGIFPWQQRLGNIPADVSPNEHHVFKERMTEESLRKKNGGIIGVVQHGDLFWDRVPDPIINRVLSIIDHVAYQKRTMPKYMLWTKRAERMENILLRRYPAGLPEYLAVSVSVENQAFADERLPHLLRLNGLRIIMIEPMHGSIDLEPYLPVDWVVVGSETGEGSFPIDVRWVSSIRDQVKAHGIPFFIKQLGNSHKVQIRKLDGHEWNEFPRGFNK
jgi:protein gp37